MKKKEQRLSIFVIVVLILLFALFNPGLLDISGGNTLPGPHNVTSHGMNYSLNAPWGSTGTDCSGVRQAHTQLYMADGSTDDQVHITGTIPDSGSSDCGTYTLSASVKLRDLDLRKYQKVVIHRAACLEASGKDRDSRLSSDLMGLHYEVIDYDNTRNYGSVKQCLGDVQTTSENGAVTVLGDEGRRVIISNDPVHYENTVTVSTSDSYNGKLDYQITGIDITEFPTPTPVVTTPTPTTNTTVPVTTPPAPEVVQGFLARLWAWVTGWFS